MKVKNVSDSNDKHWTHRLAGKKCGEPNALEPTFIRTSSGICQWN